MKKPTMGAAVVLALTLILAVSLILSGCGSSNDQTSTTAAAVAPEKIEGTISFATWGSESEIETNKKVIAAFENKYPGTKVELNYIPDDYETKMETLIAGGAAPDVVYGHPYQLRKWFAKGALADLSDIYKDPEFSDPAKYDQSFYKNFQHEGKYFGTINGQDVFLLYYNKDLFDKAGVEYPTEGWTWDDFREAAKKLTVVENGKTVQYGMTLSNWYPYAEMFIWSYGGKLAGDTYDPNHEIVIDSPEAAQGLQVMQDIIMKDKSAPTPEAQNVFGGSFEAGNVAMKIDGAWAPVFLKDVKGLNWDAMLVPKGPAGRHNPVFYAGYGVSAKSKNPATARAFATFMMEEEGQRILAETGLITVINKSVSEDPAVLGAPGMPPGNKYRIEGVEYATWRDTAALWWHEAVDKGLTPELDRLLIGEQDGATTAKNAQKLMDEVRASVQ